MTTIFVMMNGSMLAETNKYIIIEVNDILFSNTPHTQE